MTKKHISQSVEGALKNWSAKTWYKLALQENTSVKELKLRYQSWLEQGIKVLPDPECDHFDTRRGCLGH